MIAQSQLLQLWPQADKITPGLTSAVAKSAPVVFPRYGWSTDALVAIAIAQFSLEFGAGTEMLENMSYSAQRMCEVWPSRFPTLVSAEPYAHNPQALANKVYNGRMGNRPGTNDGYDYRGHGLAQLTGMSEFLAVRKLTGIDVVANPSLACAPDTALEVAVAVLTVDGCLPCARQGNFRMVTQRLNGGQTGEADRLVWWARTRRVMGITNPAAGPGVKLRIAA
jgi:putative chitinase